MYRRMHIIGSMHGESRSHVCLSRRELLKRIAGTTACIPLATLNPLFFAPVLGEQTFVGPKLFSDSDDALLEALEALNFLYFWEQANPDTGIVRDRCNVRSLDKSDLGSIAATGFASINTGERLWDSEVSSIDMAILLCGVLTCRQYFQHSEISSLASEIFNRVDWNWLSEDTSILPHGWRPESGFLQNRWDNYNEMMMMYLLGLGSLSHPLPAESWNAWKRTTFEYDGIRYIGSFAPLFVHQYSQAWFDFRGKRDKYTDYFRNSAIATDVHRRFCVDLAKQFPDYSDDLWGVTASDSAKGYAVWGGPPSTGPIDGTVVPCAAAGSLPFLPEAAMRVLRTIKDRYGNGAWCRYGFVDAFNPLTSWYDHDVIGIDTGITMVMVENARSGFVWDTFMKNPEAQRGMERAGFKALPAPGTQESSHASSPATPGKLARTTGQ